MTTIEEARSEKPLPEYHGEVEFEEDEDYETLGGYLIGQLGRIPEDDEVIEMALHGWLFQVEAFEEKRIMKVLASKLPEVEEMVEEEADENKEENEE